MHHCFYLQGSEIAQNLLSLVCLYRPGSRQGLAGAPWAHRRMISKHKVNLKI